MTDPTHNGTARERPERHPRLTSPLAAEDLQLLRPEQVAKLLGVSIHSLRRWRQLEKGPPFIRLSATNVAYPRERLRRWIAAQMEDNP